MGVYSPVAGTSSRYLCFCSMVGSTWVIAVVSFPFPWEEREQCCSAPSLATGVRTEVSSGVWRPLLHCFLSFGEALLSTQARLSRLKRGAPERAGVSVSYSLPSALRFPCAGTRFLLLASALDSESKTQAFAETAQQGRSR